MDIYTIYIHDEPNDHVRVLQSLHEYIPEHQKNCLKTNVFSSTSPHQVFQQKKTWTHQWCISTSHLFQKGFFQYSGGFPFRGCLSNKSKSGQVKSSQRSLIHRARFDDVRPHRRWPFPKNVTASATSWPPRWRRCLQSRQTAQRPHHRSPKRGSFPRYGTGGWVGW